MLTWTQRPDGWYANGYVIRLVAPFCWILTEVSAEDAPSTMQAVSIPIEPLATSRTLTEAKREAELIEAAHVRSAFYRRHMVFFLIACSVAVLVAGAAAPWGLIMTVAAGAVALGVLSRMAGHAFARSPFHRHQIFYQ
ncbi:MAG: hypothetical protein QNJ75_10785 [Acidimicrobiia bacterium]|nr:hypothetical protein [Acidimicrobiia bacterium]